MLFVKTYSSIRLQWSFFKSLNKCLFFLTEGIVYFLNTVHCYNILEEYYYYEIQIHKALCDFTVETGFCWLKESLPPDTEGNNMLLF
jgi:hypothetical protein